MTNSFASVKLGMPMIPYAVSIKKDISAETTTVGHISKMISSICSIFIRRGGTIHCTVNRPWHLDQEIRNFFDEGLKY